MPSDLVIWMQTAQRPISECEASYLGITILLVLPEAVMHTARNIQFSDRNVLLHMQDECT
jgi:hypothetical protein